MTRREKATELFKEGYNCAQAVVLAFEDILPSDKTVLARLGSSFGGGMGRLREVCGAVSGMFMVTGMLEGYSDPSAKEEKAEHYAKIQALAQQFKQETGSIVCRELLELDEQKSRPVPEARTDAYYQKRPCAELVGLAAEILEKHLSSEE